MSSNPASHFGPSGFQLVRQVLRTVGLRGSESDASSDMKRDASLFLSDEFRSGVRTKSALLNSLANRNRSADGSGSHPRAMGSALDRWQDEGGR